MPADHEQTARRFTLCLVADDEVIERFPSSIRFLQVGLIGEAVDVILIVPESSRRGVLVAGPSAVVTYPRRYWPFDALRARNAVRAMRETLDGSSRSQPMIVHALSLTAAPLAAHIAREFEAELIGTIDSNWIRREPRLQHALERASVLVLPSEGLREVVARTPLASKRSEIVRPGVGVEDEPSAFRVSGNVPSIVFATGLGPECGADVLIRAVGRVLHEGHRVLAFIAGKGPAETELRHLVDTLRLANEVTFTGRLDQLPAAMESADLFCAPRALGSFREEPVEAMAAGLAIIAADGTYCDGLEHGRSAMFIPNGDEAELAAAIQELIQSPETARRLGAGAQEMARKSYSVAKMAEDCLAIYRRLVFRGQTLALGAV